MMNFDLASIRREDGSEQRLTVAEFIQLRLSERAQLVSKGFVTFYKDGQVIRPIDAFREMGPPDRAGKKPS
jgi:hypothetical protein